MSCHGVVVGRWGYLSALACSMFAAHLGGGMNCGAVTLSSEAQHRCQGEGIKAGAVMAWASPSSQLCMSHQRLMGPLSVTTGGPFLLLAHVLQVQLAGSVR
ncbi:hypothetical protein ATO50_18765 [Aeromonas hydrophila]|nr:hypothetical protein ATO50_18765 [Aeromonas hydrophila]